MLLSEASRRAANVEVGTQNLSAGLESRQTPSYCSTLVPLFASGRFLNTKAEVKPLVFQQEFEVLAQIRLLQSSCKNCVFWSDKTFVDWYWSAPTLTEEER